MAGKKKKGRRAYLDAFQKDAKGSYVYKGDLYTRKGEQEALRRERWLLGALSGAMLAAAVASGCVTAPGAVNCAYVLIPYVINFIGSVSVFWGICRFLAGGSPLRAYVYDATIGRIPGRAAVAAFGAGGAVIGEIIFVFRHGFEGKMTGFVVFLLLEGAVLAAAVKIHCSVKKMKWIKEKQK